MFPDALAGTNYSRFGGTRLRRSNCARIRRVEDPEGEPSRRARNRAASRLVTTAVFLYEGRPIEMRSDILEKLSRELSRAPQRESDVVYLFVELRKLIQHDNARDRYPIVNMFCDWVVHVRLTGKSAAELVSAIRHQLETHPETCESISDDLFSLDVLRRELAKFLRAFGLPDTLVKDDRRWFPMVALYINVVSDCPLLAKQRNRRFSLTVESTRPSDLFTRDPGWAAVAMKWQLSDGSPRAARTVIFEKAWYAKGEEA